MPSRIIRETIITSERVDRLSQRAEVFYRRLLNVVDDYGRFDARPAILIAACYPLRAGLMGTEQIEAALAECVSGERPLIVLYTVDGKSYLEVQDFRQQVRSNKSKYPDPRSGGDARRVMLDCTASAMHTPSTRTPYSETDSETNICACAASDARLGSAHSGDDSHTVTNGLPSVNDAPFDPVGGTGADWELDSETPKDGTAGRDVWFEQFWALYRSWRATDKKRAKQAFLRAVKSRETFDAVIQGLDAQTPEMLRRPPDKRPHATTWLNGERWNDEIGAPIGDDDEFRSPRLMM
ncbi:MAG: hypothetical protein JNL98_00775 [Bryobacterales bacterium]|nr:hypothetical protein [Bryobacterales bacterium]